VTLIRRLAFSALFVIASATPLAAQYWAKPAKTPNTDVTCTNCSGKAKGQLTPGYPSTLGTYVGRYLDSDFSNDCQQPVRTMRAVDVIPKPSLNAPHGRIYMQVGSSVMAWDMDHFFQRVNAGEALGANVPCGISQPVIDTYLGYDEWYYAEKPDSGWDYSNGGDGHFSGGPAVNILSNPAWARTASSSSRQPRASSIRRAWRRHAPMAASASASAPPSRTSRRTSITAPGRYDSRLGPVRRRASGGGIRFSCSGSSISQDRSASRVHQTAG